MESSASALHWAVRSGDVSAIRKLISGGGARLVQGCDSLNRTALHWATVLGHEEAVKVLLLNTSKQFIDVKDRHGRTALHYACSAGKAQFAGLMIKRGASVNSKDLRGRTPLHYAAQNLNPDVVDLLLRNGAEKAAEDMDGVRPWDLALQWGCSDGLQALRVEKQDVGSNNPEPMQDCSQGENIDFVSPRVLGSSLDSLLADWKRAEARKKKEPRDAVKEALKAWRDSEAEARQERNKRLMSTGDHDNQASHVSSLLEASVQSARDVNMFRLFRDSNLFYLSRSFAGDMADKVDDSWGCTEWDSPMFPLEVFKDPWMKRKSISSASAIEAI